MVFVCKKLFVSFTQIRSMIVVQIFVAEGVLYGSHFCFEGLLGFGSPSLVWSGICTCNCIFERTWNQTCCVPCAHYLHDNSWFVAIMEQNKHQELPQLRSVTSMELGCDACGYSRAGNETAIWYCVILAGRSTRTQQNACSEFVWPACYVKLNPYLVVIS
ncbi:uncharacterized protein LOC114260583 isoform X1 [Camellia sinensis]|uniref:uncharacterized protein LOC114260583 isoform X1 n=1 Tax=Camellia sinensis TaxID=4442 RepID=UPI0010369403|nr:uncharacterized protein LOC114260583 isoform X1 [Camellia sinensis]